MWKLCFINSASQTQTTNWETFSDNQLATLGGNVSKADP